MRNMFWEPKTCPNLHNNFENKCRRSGYKIWQKTEGKKPLGRPGPRQYYSGSEIGLEGVDQIHLAKGGEIL